eukprot:TRINITY_DN51856_c0_g1_i1.p1 TRINITY_DN51856_c0_g1~~TRINITY_DN51856_c0_g1_i1.p1  ORF type:complete len:335 (-),score=74.70 TRINITY_DN51856_c0_g1_i1:65-1045(-)
MMPSSAAQPNAVVRTPPRPGAAQASASRRPPVRSSRCSCLEDGQEAPDETSWLASLQDTILDLLTCGGTGDEHPGDSPHPGVQSISVEDAELPLMKVPYQGGPSKRLSKDGTASHRTSRKAPGGGQVASSPQLESPPSHPAMQQVNGNDGNLPPLSLPSFSLLSRSEGYAPSVRLADQSLMTSRSRAEMDQLAAVARSQQMPQQPSFQVANMSGGFSAGHPELLSVSSSSGSALCHTAGSSAGRSTAASSSCWQGSGNDMALNVLLGGDRWETLYFHRTDNLSQRANEFIEEHQLSSLVRGGLLSQLRQMVTMKQLSASVDVVDLF